MDQNRRPPQTFGAAGATSGPFIENRRLSPILLAASGRHTNTFGARSGLRWRIKQSDLTAASEKH
jgi:hypothetical protein